MECWDYGISVLPRPELGLVSTEVTAPTLSGRPGQNALPAPAGVELAGLTGWLAGQEMHSHKSGPKGPLVLPRDGLAWGAGRAAQNKTKTPEFIKVYHQLTV